MSLTNKSMYAILGILNISPCTGYDIKKYCDTVLSGFWNENFGHIYPTLKRMLDEGTIEIVSKENGDKKVRYGITNKGKMEFQAWLREETTKPPIRSEFMLKLLFSNNLPSEDVIKMLFKDREQHEQNVARYKEMLNSLDKGIGGITRDRARFMKAVLRKAIIANEGDIMWCNETIDELRI